MFPDDSTRDTIARLFDSGRRLVYEFTGAGSLALAWLHSVAGSSRLLQEATDRYSPDALANFLGFTPQKAVSAEAAAAMSHRAYRRAVRLSDGELPCIGLACTATIATDRDKRGDHACHVAVQDRHGRTDYAIVLRKGERERHEEEALVAQLVIHALANTCGVDVPPIDVLPGEQVVRTHAAFADPVQSLIEGRVRTVTVHTDGRLVADEPFTGVLLSGSFNPLHCGHETLLRVASKFLGNVPPAFELPIVNADKPALRPNEIERRIAQARRYPVILTRAALFRDKAELFPRCTFALGYDTAVRLCDPSYYGGKQGCIDALSAVDSHGCRFLVAARPMPGEGVRTLADAAPPMQFEDLFVELPRSEFLLDLSSTQLRAGT
jgi:nicotinamide mononucleotide (NMN) deamidase PncC